MTKPTGWRRFRRWVKRILLGLLALLVLLVAVGAIYEALGRKNAAANYPPPGKLVDIGGRKMHIDCRGTGSPTVILESGARSLGRFSAKQSLIPLETPSANMNGGSGAPNL